MAHLYKALEPKSSYVDRQFRGSPDEYLHALSVSTTIYVGNISFFTTEEQIWELFSKAGEIRRIIIGLNRERMTPCGFAFVEYFNRSDAENCVKWISGTKLDDRVIRTDFDFGFIEGRQFGRGKSGGQIRDELRDDYDPGRGGYGIRKAIELTQSGQDVSQPVEAPMPLAPMKENIVRSVAPIPISGEKRKREDSDEVGTKERKPVAKRAKIEKPSNDSSSKSQSRSRSRSKSSADSKSRSSKSRSSSRSRSKSRSSMSNSDSE